MNSKPDKFDLLSAALTSTPFAVVVGGKTHAFFTKRDAVRFQSKHGGIVFQINRTNGEWFSLS